jgi:hypothetical protein
MVKKATWPAYAKTMLAIARHASCNAGAGEKSGIRPGDPLEMTMLIIVTRTAVTMLIKLADDKCESFPSRRGRVKINETSNPRAEYNSVQLPWSVSTFIMMEKVSTWLPMTKR